MPATIQSSTPGAYSPPPAQLASREDLNTAITNMVRNVQDLLTNLRTQIKEEMATPLDAQQTNKTPRRNGTGRPPCQCTVCQTEEKSRYETQIFSQVRNGI